MKDISLKELLEAGCHFGHKVMRWHPKAADYIYQAREGIHIIDLAKTRSGLKSAAEFVLELGKSGKKLLVVATKRQARGVVSQAANRAGLPYLTNRWIGGFITNWEEVKKNIDKMNKLRKESIDGSWNKFPKHEMVGLTKYLRKLETVYSGVGDLTQIPEAIFIVDIKNEIAALREALRKGMKTVAIVDTNVDPQPVDYPIPANDDAVGSIQFIVNYLVDVFLEGKKIGEKAGEREAKKLSNQQINQSTNKQIEKEEKDVKIQSFKDEKKQSEKLEKIDEVRKLEKVVRGDKNKKKGSPKKSLSS